MNYICARKNEKVFFHHFSKMVVVAQLVRAPDCGSGGRRFDSDLPPIKKTPSFARSFFITS